MQLQDKASTPGVTLLIRSMNRGTLDQLFKALNVSFYPKLEAVVINASGGTHAPLPEVDFPVRMISPDPITPLARAEAANLALENVKTPLAMFLDDDDGVDSHHIARLTGCLEKDASAVAAYAGVRLCNKEDVVAIRDEPWHDGMLWLNNFLPIHAVLFRMEAVHAGNCRFDTKFSQLEDWDFWLQLASLKRPFLHCPGVSATYRLDLGASGLSAQRDREQYARARQCIYKKWLPTLDVSGLGSAIALWVDALEQANWDLRELRHQTEDLRAGSDQHLGALRELREHYQGLQELHSALHEKHGSLWAEHYAQEERISDLLAENQRVAHQQQIRVEEVSRQREALESDMTALLNSRSWRMTTPLRSAARVARHLQRRSKPHSALEFDRNPPIKRSHPEAPIDIIVPVYRGLDETRDCLESVWASKCQTPWRLVVINDASPEPELTDWLREMAKADDPERPLTLLENPDNLGFVGTVNRGMRDNPEADVVLLNSDAEVVNNWLDRLVGAAYRPASRPVASVTPFSNNATICSYPRFCQDNELPGGMSLSEIDQLFAHANREESVDIPTGIGFCMYIRRDSLDDVGLFDEASFGKGYGEENDFCMRSLKAGWRHVHALDVFAWHKGSVSFGETQPERVTQALKVLHELHPDYESRVHRFIQQDPAAMARHRVDLLRLRESPLPRLLLVNHQRGGGTEQHCQELTELLSGEAEFLMLKPAPDGMTRLTYYSSREALALEYRLPEEFDALVALLSAIGISRVHFHHWLGLDGSIMHLAARLNAPQWVTLHDYYAACPQITLTSVDNRYCGEKGVEQCRQCLQQAPSSGGVSIETWRHEHQRWLSESERVIVPSKDAASRLERYFPDLVIEPIRHPDAETGTAIYPPPAAPHILDNEPIRVAIIGAISVIKGADEIESVAREAQKRGLQIEFRLFGYAYRDLASLKTLHVTGAYEHSALPGMLETWQPHVVWFPARWPETYSYTLSTCLALGTPVVSTDLGAIAERIQKRPLSWVLPPSTSILQWCDWFAQLPQRLKEQTTDINWQQIEKLRFYSKDYTTSLEKPIKLPDLPQSWTAHSRVASSSTSGIRIKAINGLYWLRRQSWLKSFARQVPLPWQRRIKSWLLREKSF